MDSLLISPSLPWLLTSDSVSPPTLTVSPSNTLYMYVSSPSSWVNRQNVSDGAPQLMSPSSDLWKKQMFNLLNFLKNNFFFNNCHFTLLFKRNEYVI